MFTKIRNESGFSILDIVLGIVFLSIAFTASIFVIKNLQNRSFNLEALLRADSMANSIMEIIRAHRFDENTASPWSSTLGAEEGSYNDFDDVDDFIGYTWSFSGYSNFTATSRIYYVDPDVSLDDSTGTLTNYKKIVVKVTHPVIPDGVTHSSLITASSE